MPGIPPAPRIETRASDAERDDTIALLREHLFAGRLTQDEFEERTEEACRARFRSDLWHAVRELPVPRPAGPPGFVRRPGSRPRPLTAVVLAAAAFIVMVFSLGIGFPLYLPLGATAWLLARRARRAVSPGSRGPAIAAEVLGLLTTVVGLMALAGCGVVVLALA